MGNNELFRELNSHHKNDKPILFYNFLQKKTVKFIEIAEENLVIYENSLGRLFQKKFSNFIQIHKLIA